MARLHGRERGSGREREGGRERERESGLHVLGIHVASMFSASTSSSGRAAFTVFVAVQGLTDLDTDLVNDGSGERGVDRFGTMLRAFDAGDRREIRDRALRTFGSDAAFNFAMVVVRSAVILRYAAQHPVRPAAPAHRNS